MRTYEIIKLATNMRERYGTNDPFKLCELLEFKIRKITLNPKVYKAFTLNMFGEAVISLNENYTETSQKVLCSHELGHAILHKDSSCNEFGGNDLTKEYEANLFGVALLFDENDFDLPFSRMSDYMLHEILNYNIKLK